MLLLLGAVLMTAVIIALLRYGSVGGRDHVTPLLGTFTVFAAGGVPVALMCWSLERRVSGGSSRASRNRIRHVLIPNALAAVVGIFPLYLLVWDWYQAFAVVGALAVLGSVMCLVALTVGDKVRLRTADPDDAIEHR
jgi:hypothetical protein